MLSAGAAEAASRTRRTRCSFPKAGLGKLERATACEAAERYVGGGKVLDLGKTPFRVVGRIGELLAGREPRDVRGMPPSERTAAPVREAGVPLVSPAEARPDLAIDGADEMDPDGGQYIMYYLFSGIAEPASLRAEIKHPSGAPERGLFAGMARRAVVARDGTEGRDGSGRTINPGGVLFGSFEQTPDRRNVRRDPSSSCSRAPPAVTLRITWKASVTKEHEDGRHT